MDPDTLFLTLLLAPLSGLVLFHFCWQRPRRQMRRRKLAQTAAQLGLVIQTGLVQLPFDAQQKLLFFGQAAPDGPAPRRLLKVAFEDGA